MLSVLVSPQRLRAAGGLVRFALGFVLEVAVSALIAPIQAMSHCGILSDVLRGRDAGWRPQRRQDDSPPWSEVLYRHRWHMFAGVALGLAASAISWQMLAWLAPAIAGMTLAAPLSKLTASARLGRQVMRPGLLRTPEESQAPAISSAADRIHPLYREAVERAPGLLDIVEDEELMARHLLHTDRPLTRPRGEVDVVEAVAEKKIRDACSVAEAVASLTPEEQGYVQALPALLALLVRRRPELPLPSPRPRGGLDP